jgi:small basic protein (TIGR04137 family)
LRATGIAGGEIDISRYQSGVIVVTLDKSLKGRGRLTRARGVLSRDERIAKMKEEERWADGRSPFGLPKIRVLKAASKKKKKKEEAAEGAEGTAAAATAAAPAATEAPAKGKGDAKGGKK